MPAPSFTPAYVLAVITTIIGLFLTQGLIDNGVGKLVTGLATVLVPLILAAVHVQASSRVHAARIAAAGNPPAPVAAAIPVKHTK